jgi:hypothetical protein
MTKRVYNIEKENEMKPNLFRSRKFWIMVFDVAVSTATYFLTAYAAPDIGKNIIWLIASWQPVVYAVINGIATEDAANIANQ